MTAPNEPFLPYGFRFVRLYELDNNGMPAATGTTPYEGVQIKGATAFELTVAEPRKFTGLGEDGITAVVYLPPTEGITGVLNVDADDPDISAIITGNAVRTLGDANLSVVGSSNQGFEPVVGLMLSQAMRGLNTGKQYWRTYILPAATLIMRDGGMTAEKSSTSYSIAPSVVTRHLHGETMIEAEEGAVSAQAIKVWSNNPLRYTAFVGNGLATEFSFPSNSASNYSTATLVFVNGARVTSGITITPTGVTFSTAPDDGDKIVVWRETEKFNP